ncbi:MAG: glycerophosphodiester phosphodiesterase family protein [Calditrichia bacterium]
MNLPLLFAHRGANSFGPENSLSAFAKAIEMGCDGIELDVRITADDKLVVFHDRNTLRMTGFRGSIQRMTFNKLRELRLGGEGFSPEKIPSLAELLDLAGKKLLINLDIKKERFSGSHFEQKIVALLNDFGLQENTVISSFNPFVLKRISSLNPALHLGYIYSNRSSLMMLNGHPVESLHVRYRLLSRRYLQHLQQRGLKVYAWTVDRLEAMQKLLEKGIDGIITNRPEYFLEMIKTRQDLKDHLNSNRGRD